MSDPAAPLNLAVLVSGSGRTLENLLERIADGRLAARVGMVVSSRPDVRGVAIARRAHVPVAVLPPAGRARDEWSAAVFGACRDAAADLVVMAGFLHLIDIPPDFVDRVINIHPSLLPAFGGRGFHGMHVHRAVLERGCTISGCTVHLVDAEYDHGRILLQRAVPVLPDDTAESLAARVFAAECAVLPEAIARIATAARRSASYHSQTILPEASACTVHSAT
ncbi:MAG TPA: phosphoribosylglycinamide formyltransferase [Planctomycetaceae bacterium]|nr:phosphoribosylglycinamide formyltransferase [Planctomycetaceae bacterium]